MKSFIVGFTTVLLIFSQMTSIGATTIITIYFTDFDTQTFAPLDEEGFERKASCEIMLESTNEDLDFIKETIDSAVESDDFQINTRLKLVGLSEKPVYFHSTRGITMNSGNKKMSEEDYLEFKDRIRELFKIHGHDDCG